MKTNHIERGKRVHVTRIYIYKPGVRLNDLARYDRKKYAWFSVSNKLCNGQECDKLIFHGVYNLTR